jgi:hypothetical protein
MQLPIIAHHASMQIVLMTQSELALQLNVHGADLAGPVHLSSSTL